MAEAVMPVSTLSVMVVEDHGFQRRMALRLLAELGVEDTTEAADGRSALALLARRHAPPDVVMVDLDMPGMDGVEFIGHLAQGHLARSVLVVSALDPALLSSVQTMSRGYGLKVLGIVEKPLTGGKLAAALAGFELLVAEPEADDSIEISATAIREALARGELVAWFQPQVELGNGKPVGVEALARWVRPDGRLVRPDHFIALLEREGLVPALTDAMLEQSCRWKREWERQGLRLRVSVNISARVLEDPTSVDRYQRIVADHGVDPAEVILELTESSVAGDPTRALGILARMRLKGFGLSIDDFGTGYSSLAQLSQIPFTELKIDQGFVHGAHEQPRRRAVVEASLDLARKLGLDVVAEGVSMVEDWRMLAELGCSIAQGNLISPPVAPDELAAALGRWRRPES